jgi:hypothetical protein
MGHSFFVVGSKLQLLQAVRSLRHPAVVWRDPAHPATTLIVDSDGNKAVITG